MSRVVHVIGNGDCATFYRPAPGIKLTCNLPAFDIADVYGTVMVDFKMMKALADGAVKLDAYDWVLGFRPKKWMEMQPNFYLKYAKNVKEFWTEKPPYVPTHTEFSCGHMAVHYAVKKLKATEVHMYGFDSLFDMNLRSVSDLYLFSDRSPLNTVRINNGWRPIWEKMFDEFRDTKFILYHKHNQIKIKHGSNVTVDTSRAKK